MPSHEPRIVGHQKRNHIRNILRLAEPSQRRLVLPITGQRGIRSEEHTSELQSPVDPYTTHYRSSPLSPSPPKGGEGGNPPQGSWITPPSTITPCPVMNRASSDTRNAITSAISSGSPSRRSAALSSQ